MANVLAFLLAYGFRGTFPDTPGRILYPLGWYLDLLWIILPLWAFLFYLTGLYQFWRGPGFWKETWAVFKTMIIASFLLGSGVFAIKYQFVSRIFILSFAIFDFLLILLFRWISRKCIDFLSNHSESYRFILIVGTGDPALRVARGIASYRDLGLRVLGFLSTKDNGTPPKLLDYPVLGSAADLPQILEREVVDEVVFAISQEEIKRMEELFLTCEERGITTRIILNFFPYLISKTHLEELDGLPLLTFSTAPENEVLLFLLRVLDLMGSIFLIALFSPFFILGAVLIRLDSPGPVLYKQTRCGLNGRKFIFYKFRSMYTWADERKKDLTHLNLMNGPVFKMRDDPRITRVGRFLRKTSLDELPQLLNVLKGDMGFVGPRPLMDYEVERFEGWHRRRLSMKPGITGLWQVSGRNQIDFNEWMKLDLEYIDNWSLWLDLKILLKTIPVVLLGKGAM